ncbi:MAG: hypothetical protein ACI9W6_002442 [Motiliproteus sp.]|jgi:hypothetical protein
MMTCSQHPRAPAFWPGTPDQPLRELRELRVLQELHAEHVIKMDDIGALVCQVLKLGNAHPERKADQD